MKRRIIPLWARQKGAILFFLALLIFSTAIAYAGFGLLAIQNHVEYGEINPPSSLVPPRGRMLVILLDSARKDFTFSDHMPFISSLRERGAWGISEVASVPLTFAGDQAIFSGTVASPLAFFEDFQPSTTTSDNLFMRVTQRGGRAVIFGGFLQGVYGKYIDLSVFQHKPFLFSQYREEARYVFRQAYHFLKKEQWDLAVVPFYAIDYQGHLETPRSPNYGPTLRLIDEYVRLLVEVTTDQDVVLITAEHGMDDNGFHADRAEMVMETPFILLGPRVKKGGPTKVLQIDWAPTLSILAGVSPFYESPALPALDLLKLPAEDKSMMIKLLSKVITGTSTPMTLNELRDKRLANMGRKGSIPMGVFMVSATLLSMALLAYVSLSDGDLGWTVRSRIWLIGGGILGLCALIGIEFYVGVSDYVSSHLPFSANLIFANPWQVAAAFALIAALPMFYVRLFGKRNSNLEDGLLLFLFTLLFTGGFLSANPYHPLNWLVFSIPLVAWGLSRRPVWILLFGAFWIGLAIRRLTFYNVYTPISLPDRWLLAAGVLVVGFSFLWWRLREDPERISTLSNGLLLFVPGVAAIAWPSTVEVRTILLILLLIPVALVSLKKPITRDVWLSLWVVFFYLGTSSNINHTTHIVALPILIAIWVAARGTSAVARGIMISLFIWAFYLLPGNGFGLKLIELTDQFILGSAMTEHIERTVLVIASRYILPATVLLWGMTWADSGASTVSMVSTALLPALCGIGVRLSILVSTAYVGFPWEELARLPVLLGYFVAVISAFLIVASVKSVTKLLWFQALAINHTLSRKV